MFLEEVGRNAAEILKVLPSIATILGALLAGWWFLFTRSFSQRIQFDVDLQILDIGHPENYLAEVGLIVENKGQRQHRIYNLFCEARRPRLLEAGDGEPHFPATNFVTEQLEYFFVSAGVRQRFTKSFFIPKSEKAVFVIGLFSYGKQKLKLPSLRSKAIESVDVKGVDTHTTTRIFSVQPRTFGDK